MASNSIIDLETIEENYMCSICSNVFKDPFRPNVCNHTFCNDCIQRVSISGNTCPFCRRRFTNIVANNMIKKEINSHSYVCNNCNKVVRLNNYNSHSSKCNSATTPKTSFLLPSNYASRQQSSINSSLNSLSIGKSFDCPYCDQINFTMAGLRGHCNQYHPNGPKEVVCPICANQPWGDPKQKSIDFIQHLNLRHKFEYDDYVDFNIDDDQMLQKAINLSLVDVKVKRRVNG